MTISYKRNTCRVPEYFNVDNNGFAAQLLNMMQLDLNAMFNNVEIAYDEACDKATAVANAGGFDSAWYFQNEDEMKRFDNWIENKASEELREQYEEARDAENLYGSTIPKELEELEEHLYQALKIAEYLELEYKLK